MQPEQNYNLNLANLPKQQEDETNYQFFSKLTQRLNKISCVFFAFYAANLVKNSSKQEAHHINLIEQWLEKPDAIVVTEIQNTYANSWNINAAWAGCSEATWTAFVATYNVIIEGEVIHAAAASATNAIVNSDDPSDIKTKLLNYLGYLLPKEPKLNNFNIDLLKQNQQAYSFLEKISKLEDYQVTDEDLFGIRQIFDVLEEIGAPLDPNEFIWDGETTEKHKLLQAIRREF